MEWLSGLVQGIFGSALYDLLLATTVAGFIAWLKSKQSRWAAPALYGIAAFSAVLVISYVPIGHALTITKSSETTSENVKEHVRIWLDGYGVSVQNEEVTDNVFTFRVTLHSGNVIGVMRPKDKPGAIILRADISMAPEYIKAFESMTKEQQGHIIAGIMLEMARSRVSYHMGSPLLARGMTITQAFPISNALTEESFGARLDEMNQNVQLARATVMLAFEGKGSLAPAESSVKRP